MSPGVIDQTFILQYMKRISGIDITRGLVMVIMALDHVRDLLHITSLTQQPTDLSSTTPALFFTRFVTHLCAPAFLFLAGTSAFLAFQTSSDHRRSRNFLLKRGLILLLLEFTLVNFSMFFDLHFQVFIFEVIGAIGFGFVILALLLNLKSEIIGIIGLCIFLLHDLTALLPMTNHPLQQVLFGFFRPGALPVPGGRLFVMTYPPIPWLGIMLMGYSAGRLFLHSEARRRPLLLRIGLGAIAGFLLLRFLNVYGDASWSTQSTPIFTVLSFLNVTKYPPSLQFGLLMLGGMFLILYVVDDWQGRVAGGLSTYGRAPLFYFIVHWYFIHALLFAIVFSQGYGAADLVFGFNFGRPKGPSGVSLTWVYACWALVVAIMYPLCRWYGKVKHSRGRHTWLRYL